MCYNRYGDIMASSIIHVAVANELNKKLNVDRNQLLIGSIAPDISKLKIWVTFWIMEIVFPI